MMASWFLSSAAEAVDIRASVSDLSPPFGTEVSLGEGFYRLDRHIFDRQIFNFTDRYIIN